MPEMQWKSRRWHHLPAFRVKLLTSCQRVEAVAKYVEVSKMEPPTCVPTSATFSTGGGGGGDWCSNIERTVLHACVQLPI